MSAACTCTACNVATTRMERGGAAPPRPFKLACLVRLLAVLQPLPGCGTLADQRQGRCRWQEVDAAPEAVAIILDILRDA